MPSLAGERDGIDEGNDKRPKPVHLLSRTRKPLVVAGAALAVMALGATSAQAAEKCHAGAYAEVYSDRVERICWAALPSGTGCGYGPRLSQRPTVGQTSALRTGAAQHPDGELGHVRPGH